ncbi:autotransporter assembly complex family protein [Henriciella sp. AS95]|uniref:autotransporter assembly complex protein TamA n=1 Tax=Henriciella sp. AS95 TaxID=3135782 RepID=UPI00316DE006
MAGQSLCQHGSDGMNGRLTTLCVIAAIAASTAAAEQVRLEFTGDEINPEFADTVRDALPDEKQPKTVLEARRQGRRAVDAITAKLNSEGYYDPRIDLGIDNSEPPAARLRVDPGPEFTLASVEVDFNGNPPRSDDEAKVRNELPVKTGRRAIPSEVIDAERWITATLREQGYPYAEVIERQVFGDREAETLDVRYRVSAGPRVRFGETIIPQDKIETKATYLRRLIPYDEGDQFTPGKLSLLNTRLAETRLFDVARASLADTPSGTADDGAEIRNVEVTLTERPRNTVALGASYSTAEGAGVNAELTRRNLTRRGDLLVGELTIAELEQSLNIDWRRPNEFGYGRGLVINTGISNEVTDAYERQSFTLGAGYEVVEGPQFSYSYGVKGEIAKETDEFGERDLQILSVYGATRLDHTDSLLDPRSGWRANARVEPSYAFGDDSNPFVRSFGQVSGYIPFDSKQRFVLAGRLKIGAVLGANAAELPADTRFYSGGGGSVRGYAYQGIGPKSDDGTPLGGKSVVETSVETRYRWRPNIGIVAFLDAGAVSQDEFSNFEDAKYGAGLGVRYTTPAGPIRLDVAAPLNPSDFDDPVQIYISIGQAF